MTQHLREDEYSSILAGDARQEWLRHLTECPECTRRLEQDQRRVEQIKAVMVSAATRPESDWSAQRMRIAARLRQPDHSRVLRVWQFAVASMALAILVLAVVLMQPRHAPTLPQHPQVARLTDEQLMQEMEEVANSEVPAAMDPTNVLSGEMEYRADSSPNQLHINTTPSLQGR